MSCQQSVWENQWEKIYSDREELSDYIEYLQSKLEQQITECYPDVLPDVILDYVRQSDLDEPFNSDDFEVYCYEIKNKYMLGNDAMEFLKTLHKLDEIWKQHDDAEYNERQLTQFAERYHEHKLKLLSISDVVGRSEQLVCDCKSCKPFPNHAAGMRKNKNCIKQKAN